MEDARREKKAEEEAAHAKKRNEPAKDYTLKDGEKIHIAVSKVAGRRSSTGVTTKDGKRMDSNAGAGAGGFLKPPTRDTPRRASINR